MANVTVSSAVDTMLQSANNAAIRSNIGAGTSNLSTTDIENTQFLFNEEQEFDSNVTFNDDVQFQGLIEADSASGIDFTGGGGISGATSISCNNLIAGSFVQLQGITTTARNALSASNGMIIYNSTDNKFQAYENGGWTNLI
jgi:hypothetical protein